MDRIKVNAFFHRPDDPLIQAFKALVQEFGDQIELNVQIAGPELRKEYNLSSLPAVFVGDFVKFCGILPDHESMVKALKESGLE